MKKPESHRLERVNSLLREEITRRLIEELRGTDAPLFTVTRVSASPDLSVADVFVLPDDPAVAPGKAMNAVKKVLPRIERAIKPLVAFHRMPRLRARVDEGAQHQQRIEEILDKINRDASRGSSAPH